ncbi:MAG: histidine--tRNA ligase [Ignavibacteria bacterium]|nr:histidine--tRNA ligase [Ignavibacteria bacterium]MDP3831406.1 histidine--tRNA ligase [Ignavibacteriaceae bacterium]
MIKAVTGAKDILPNDIPKWYFIEELIRNFFSNYNYKEIRTPIFEETAVFSRAIGEETDIVSKEMYTFVDRSETSITLKPEMTAAVVRAYIEHSLGNLQSLNKLFYISPMFRQERPQAGRLRQFHQFGAEAIGGLSPLLDAEIIIIAYSIIQKLGLKEFVLKINSLGIPESREKYKVILGDYLKNHFDELSEESKKRFHKNILRIFDSKSPEDQEILKNAPYLINHLDENSIEHFNIVKTILDNNKIPYEVDPALVRGLDYYTHTTFEIVSGSVGSQSALCGGGRYDNLIEQLGGKPTPGVGFAAGIERLILAMENEAVPFNEPSPLDVFFVLLDKDKYLLIPKFANLLRNVGLKVEHDYLQRSIKAQMREANREKTKFVVFVGGDEFTRNLFTVKNMSDGVQTEIPIEDSLSSLITMIKGN